MIIDDLNSVFGVSRDDVVADDVSLDDHFGGVVQIDRNVAIAFEHVVAANAAPAFVVDRVAVAHRYAALAQQSLQFRQGSYPASAQPGPDDSRAEIERKAGT